MANLGIYNRLAVNYNIVSAFLFLREPWSCAFKKRRRIFPPLDPLEDAKKPLRNGHAWTKAIGQKRKKIKYQLHASAHCVSCTSRLSNRPRWTNHATNHARWTFEETALTSLLSDLARYSGRKQGTI